MSRRKRGVCLALIVLLLFPSGILLAQDPGPVSLIPFRDTVNQLAGLAPAGWRQADPGIYLSVDDPEDMAGLMMLRFPQSAAGDVLDLVLQQMGITEAPGAVGVLATGAFEWTLFKIDIAAPDAASPSPVMDIATAESDGHAFLVLMQANEEDYPALHDALFLPVVNALRVLVPLSGRERAATRDYWPTEAWRPATPEQQGMDSGVLADMLALIMEAQIPIDGITLVRNGYLVTDVYFAPFAVGERHPLYSVTKSFTATLLGIALNQGVIDSLTRPVVDFFPAAEPDNFAALVTLEHLLTMSSGVRCAESLLEGNGDSGPALALQMQAPPGVMFEYCSSGSDLLAAVIQEATGQTAATFAEEHLFAPLGITSATWPLTDLGYSTGGSDLLMSTHDMARLGYLYLNGGLWDGQEILSEDWVRAATSSHIETGDGGYGYHWWTPTPGLYAAIGYAGQYIIVMPEYDLVTVIVSSLGQQDSGLPLGLFYEYILPAVRADDPLPPNPEALSRLAAIAMQAATGAPPLPDIAMVISGQTFRLAPNDLGWESLALYFTPGEEEAGISINSSEVAAVGLGDLGRIADGALLGGLTDGQVSLLGRWQDDRTFALDYRPVGSGGAFHAVLAFAEDGATLSIEVRPLFSGEPETFEGVLAE